MFGAFIAGVIAAAVLGSAFTRTDTVVKTRTVKTTVSVPGPTVPVPGPTTTEPMVPEICRSYIQTVNRMYDQFTAFETAYGSVPDELKKAVVAIGAGDVTAINAVTGNLKPMNENAVQAEVLLQNYMVTAMREKRECDQSVR